MRELGQCKYPCWLGCVRPAGRKENRRNPLFAIDIMALLAVLAASLRIAHGCQKCCLSSAVAPSSSSSGSRAKGPAGAERFVAASILGGGSRKRGLRPAPCSMCSVVTSAKALSLLTDAHWNDLPPLRSHLRCREKSYCYGVRRRTTGLYAE